MDNPYKSPEYVEPGPRRKVSLLMAFAIVYFSIATYGKLRACIDEMMQQGVFEPLNIIACLLNGIAVILLIWLLTSEDDEEEPKHG